MTFPGKGLAARLTALAAWAAGALLGLASLLPVCDLHFDCGCTWIWAGGAARCDIHTAGPPDCPWCADPSGIGAVLGGVLLLTLAGALAWGAGRPWTVAAGTLLAVAGAAPVTGWMA